MAIGLYGDLALGDAPFAAEVWAHPELYARGVSIGAPPDAYSDLGQNWGLSPLDPLALRRDRFRFAVRLLRNAFRHVGALRVDHVMGLTRQFWIPAGASGAAGAYVRFPFEELAGIIALESRRAGALVVGEDLGVVPGGLRERMAELALLRSQVLYFEREDNGEPRLPRHYARAALATVATHDLPPIAGYWQARDLVLRRRAGNIASDEALQRMRAEREHAKAGLLGLLRREGLLAKGPEEPSIEELVLALCLLLASAESRLICVALDDLTLERDALNVPATALADQPNWSRRSSSSIEELVRDPRVAELLRLVKERARQA
jgi:4-alpha-glucanotransferase